MEKVIQEIKKYTKKVKVLNKTCEKDCRLEKLKE
jgi:hypothetical protein